MNGSWDAYLESATDFAGVDDIITNLAKVREPWIEIPNLLLLEVSIIYSIRTTLGFQVVTLLHKLLLKNQSRIKVWLTKTRHGARDVRKPTRRRTTGNISANHSGD